MRLKNQTYDKLKTVALNIAPILTFISALCTIWGVPYSAQLTASVAAFDTLIGAMLVKSTEIYRAEKEQDNYNTDDNEGYEYEDTTDDTEE